MNFGLTENTLQKIYTTFKNHQEIEEVIIFGSRAKGNFRDGSDIDLTLKGENLKLEILSKLNQEIDELNTPYLFDISIFENLDSSELINHINRIGKVFYTNKII